MCNPVAIVALAVVLILPSMPVSPSVASGTAGSSLDGSGARVNNISVPRPGGDLYALVVGISKYKEPKIRELDFAAHDAEDFGKLLRKQEHIFRDMHIKVLVNEQATKRAMEKYLTRDLRKSGKDDTVILFFSGHGVYDPERASDFYFCAYDLELGYYSATAVKMSGLEFLKGLDTKRVLIIADACHAGGFSEWKDKDLPPNLEVFLQEFKDSMGRIIITSAGFNEKSWELKEIDGQPMKNGVFTHFLLKGLEGKADANRDGKVTVNEAYEFTYKMTKAATHGMQHPQFEGRHSGAFPITFAGKVTPMWKLRKSLVQAVAAGNLKKVKELRAEMLDISNVRDDEHNRTPLIVAAQNGHAPVVKFLVSLPSDLEARSDAGDTALIAAASNGYQGIVRLLLERAANPNAKNKEDESALTVASRRGHASVVKLLLDRGAKVKALNSRGSTALALAAYKGHLEIVELLLSRGARINTRDFKGRTPLSLASRYGHSDIVKKLISKMPKAKSLGADDELIRGVMLGDAEKVQAAIDSGTDVNMKTPSSDTPLTLASGLGHARVAGLLLDRGADVNSKIKYDSTALIWAAYNGQTEVVKLLLNRGAQVQARDKGGCTALTYAAQNGHKKIVELLVARGADVNNRSYSGNTPLLLAAKRGRRDIAGLLLAKGANPETANNTGYTPLITAAENGHMEVVKLLLGKEPRVNAQTNLQYSALMSASQNGHKEIVKLLLAKEAAVDLTDLKGAGALFLAAKNGHVDVVRILLSHGADPDAETREGITPLSVAAAGGHSGVVRLLEKAPAKSRLKNRRDRSS